MDRAAANGAEVVIGGGEGVDREEGREGAVRYLPDRVGLGDRVEFIPQEAPGAGLGEAGEEGALRAGGEGAAVAGRGRPCAQAAPRLVGKSLGGIGLESA